MDIVQTKKGSKWDSNGIQRTWHLLLPSTRIFWYLVDTSSRDRHTWGDSRWRRKVLMASFLLGAVFAFSSEMIWDRWWEGERESGREGEREMGRWCALYMISCFTASKLHYKRNPDTWNITSWTTVIHLHDTVVLGPLLRLHRLNHPYLCCITLPSSSNCSLRLHQTHCIVNV